ncbi:hypothetical protein KUT99_05750 [Pseudomonas aeruginosa]|nr:hypothetical protein [Pseudomonas aeruginosa]MBV5930481.1 hypothetical protein [Pseudomonas aeruginosa]
MTESKICTCPSGDGSLRWPCPAHPAVEQAGGDEREEFEAWMHTFDLPPQLDGETFADERYLEAACFGQFVYDDPLTQRCWAAWQARAALAQPSLMPPDRGPWHAVKWDGGRRVDLSSDDFEHDVALTVSGDFVEGDKFRYAQELAAWMNAHLAQPSPVQAEQHWPKLEQPAKVGGVRFSAGVSSRLVVEAAQRLYEFESTPEQEAERIERLQAFREQLDPLNLAPHAEAFNEAPAEALKSDQAEAERPEVVGYRVSMPDEPELGHWLEEEAESEPQIQHHEPLMTVAQHERIVKGWIERWKAYIELSAKIAAQRDAALARVAELESKLAELEMQAPVAFLYRGTDMGDQLTLIRLDHYWRPKYSTEEHDYIKGIPLYAAPVAQAQHSVPEGWRDMLAELQWHYEPYDDHYHTPQGFYCPVCGGEKDEGHKQGCNLAELLAAATSGAYLLPMSLSPWSFSTRRILFVQVEKAGWQLSTGSWAPTGVMTFALDSPSASACCEPMAC